MTNTQEIKAMQKDFPCSLKAMQALLSATTQVRSVSFGKERKFQNIGLRRNGGKMQDLQGNWKDGHWQVQDADGKWYSKFWLE